MNLSTEYSDRLVFIEKIVRELWKPHELSHYFFTPHDASHSKGVIDYIDKLLPTQQADIKQQLNEKELFYLYSAAWLHDIGMIPELFDDDPKDLTKERYLSVRENHHIRSKEYVEKNFQTLLLNRQEAMIIGELCRLHRRREDINSQMNLSDVRVSLLGAYLRIADSIHIDSSRVDVFEGLYNLFLSLGMPLSSEFHWLRSIWIDDIIIDHNSAAIKIIFNLSKNDQFDDLEYLCKTTVDDILEEIASCKNVLLKEKVSYFIEVQHDFNNLPPTDEQKAKLKQIISKLKMRNTASSSQLADIMMDTITYIASNYSKKEADALNMISNYTKSEIGEIKTDRPCHVLVKYVEALINSTITDESIDNKEKIKQIIQKISFLQNERKKNIDEIAINAKSLLTGYSSILLFGYSSIIIKIFDYIEDENIKKYTPIYILECRSKNQLNFKNDLVYCDGFRYAKHLKKTGFEEIYFVPDIISGNLIAGNKIQKIFFGANTVDIENQIIGHTAGHNTIIHSALNYNIPIYVFADSYKFGRLSENPGDSRTTDWFTGNTDVKNEIQKLDIKYYNPRSDIIPMKYVHEFYTDCGSFTPNQIPKKLMDKIDNIKNFLKLNDLNAEPGV